MTPELKPFEDRFRGDNENLLDSTEALLALDKENALVPHGIGGHARNLLNALAARLITTQSALNAAREAIENAPHGQLCEVILFDGDRCEHLLKCDCWKSSALAQIDKALSPQQSKTT